MRLNFLSNQELHDRLLGLSARERAITLEILHHLREVEHRRSFLEMGYPNLYEYVVRGLKYSEAAAQRRIASMRMLKELPELEEKLKTGEIKVTQVAQVQSFLRAEKGSGKSYSLEQKRDLLQSTIGKSTRETEKLLVEKSPAYALRAGPLKERIREVSAAQSQVSFIADEDLIQQLKQIRDRFAQRLPQDATPGDVIRFMAKFVLENDPMLRKTRREEKETKGQEAEEQEAEEQEAEEQEAEEQEAEGQETEGQETEGQEAEEQELPPAAEVTSRAHLPVNPRMPPRPLQRLVWRRDSSGGCTATYDGKRCGSRLRLQIDHYPVPYAQGGSSTDPNNLRLVCFQCNQLAAQKVFGRFRS